MRVVGSGASILLALGILSAIAALFGPETRWYGVDLGATGAALFVLTLGAAIALFAMRGEQVFPEHTSITERRAWVGLSFLVFILAAFIREMVMLSGHAEIPERLDDLLSHRFVQRYIVLAIVWSVISYLIGRRVGGVEADERDLRMQRRADRAGDLALTLIVIGGIVVLASVPQEMLSWWLAPIVLANVLIGLLVAKLLVEHAVLVFSYRRA